MHWTDCPVCPRIYSLTSFYSYGTTWCGTEHTNRVVLLAERDYWLKQPYAIFGLDKRCLVTSGRVWVAPLFYKRILLPCHLFFLPREAARIIRTHSWCALLREAPRNAVKLVYRSLCSHRETAVKREREDREWKQMTQLV